MSMKEEKLLEYLHGHIPDGWKVHPAYQQIKEMIQGRAEQEEIEVRYIDIILDLYDQLEKKKSGLTKEWYDLCVICGEEFKKNDVIQYFPVTDCMAHIDCMFLPKPEVTEEWINKKADELFHHTDELFKWEQLKNFIRSLIEELVEK